MIALGDLGEARALPIVREGFSSRSDEVVVACARAAGALLARPGVPADDVRDRLAALFADADASQAARGAALDSLSWGWVFVPVAIVVLPPRVHSCIGVCASLSGAGITCLTRNRTRSTSAPPS